ncbi:hypothetical protein XIS1_2070003 [Xenorhabdus innexi]|uniref:Uncharacterized protein n=1 Tax=Xenorhabdus innexi TaxID=290109 RepID=A0A1N6MX15_9GAMM|nr:hypothetical protein XIS1_2070003 [Xenorhabdus innexi]
MSDSYNGEGSDEKVRGSILAGLDGSLRESGQNCRVYRPSAPAGESDTGQPGGLAGWG